MRIKRGKFQNFSNWVSDHKFALILVPSILAILASGAVSALIIFQPASDEEIIEEPQPEPPKPDVKYFSHLTGHEIPTAAALNQAATCIMIENSPNARPQSGLRNAGIIHEAVAEGGITRYLAIFQDAMPELIGPVRSVRLYYAHWAKVYECSIAHVGGAEDALTLIRNPANGYRDIDQFFNAGSYWRARDRYAPHNVYTNAENMNALNTTKGYTSSNFTGLARANAGKTPTRSATPATAIDMQVSSALYNPSYEYNPVTNTYLRSHQSGGAHMDKDGDGTLIQNSPDVVIALMVDQKLAANGKHTNITTTGTGTAHIFQNGEYIAANWVKPTLDDELHFYDAEDNPIIFNRGQIWITAVSINNSVTWQ